MVHHDYPCLLFGCLRAPSRGHDVDVLIGFSGAADELFWSPLWPACGVWRGTFDGSLPPRHSRRKPDVIFALMMRNRFLGAMLVLEELRVRKRDDAFELVNSVQGTWGRDLVLRQLIALTVRRERRKGLG